jgi:uncharacterized membrane protein
MDLYEKILSVFDVSVSYIILFVELIGIGVLVYTVFKALISLLLKHERVRLDLAEGIALSLEFKLGGELLRTVVVREWEELLILGAVVLLRAAMTFLIQWEIRIEKKHAEERRLLQEAQNEKK